MGREPCPRKQEFVSGSCSENRASGGGAAHCVLRARTSHVIVACVFFSRRPRGLACSLFECVEYRVPLLFGLGRLRASAYPSLLLSSHTSFNIVKPPHPSPRATASTRAPSTKKDCHLFLLLSLCLPPSITPETNGSPVSPFGHLRSLRGLAYVPSCCPFGRPRFVSALFALDCSPSHSGNPSLPLSSLPFLPSSLSRPLFPSFNGVQFVCIECLGYVFASCSKEQQHAIPSPPVVLSPTDEAGPGIEVRPWHHALTQKKKVRLVDVRGTGSYWQGCPRPLFTAGVSLMRRYLLSGFSGLVVLMNYLFF